MKNKSIEEIIIRLFHHDACMKGIPKNICDDEINWDDLEDCDCGAEKYHKRIVEIVKERDKEITELKEQLLYQTNCHEVCIREIEKRDKEIGDLKEAVRIMGKCLSYKFKDTSPGVDWHYWREWGPKVLEFPVVKRVMEESDVKEKEKA